MDIFERINSNSPLNTEEIRNDSPATKPLSTAYRGIAPDNSATSEAVWSIVKIEYDGSGFESRRRLFQNVVWDNRQSLGIE